MTTSSVSLRGRALAGPAYVQRAERLRQEAARVRSSAGEHLERAAEALAEGDSGEADRLRKLAEMDSCHYLAYDELAAAAEHRGLANGFARGTPAHEVELHRAYAAIRRAEAHRERGEALRCGEDAFGVLRHRQLAEEAEEKSRIAELRAFEILENHSGAAGRIR